MVSEEVIGIFARSQRDDCCSLLRASPIAHWAKYSPLGRQAAQLLVRQNYGQKVQLPRIQSTCQTGKRLSEESRAYFPEQVNLIAHNLPASGSLAVRIDHATGVRARELLILRRAERTPASARRLWSDARFAVRTGVRYMVRGKRRALKRGACPGFLGKRTGAAALGPDSARQRPRDCLLDRIQISRGRIYPSCSAGKTRICWNGLGAE